jgi:hypothetical protein
MGIKVKAYSCKTLGSSLEVMLLHAAISDEFVADETLFESVRELKTKGFCRDDNPDFAMKLIELVRFSRNSGTHLLDNDIPEKHYEQIERAAFTALFESTKFGSIFERGYTPIKRRTIKKSSLNFECC